MGIMALIVGMKSPRAKASSVAVHPGKIDRSLMPSESKICSTAKMQGMAAAKPSISDGMTKSEA